MEADKKLDRVMVNITWNCNLNNCPYCWHREKNGILLVAEGKYQTKKDRSVDEWITALNTLEPAIFDFVGGEPFFLKDFQKICENLDEKHKFAITSNMNIDFTQEFIKKISPKNCLSITGSYHITSKIKKEEFARRLLKLQNAGFTASVNIVNHKTYEKTINALKKFFRKKKLKVFISPYEDPAELQSLKAPFNLVCNGGLTHYIINNDGNAYRCLSWFRYFIGRNTGSSIKGIQTKIKMKLHKAFMGNIFSKTFKKLDKKTSCNIYCEMKYVVDQINSMVASLEIEELK